MKNCHQNVSKLNPAIHTKNDSSQSKGFVPGKQGWFDMEYQLM